MRTQCIWDLKRFQISRNCCLFSSVWLLRNFHSADANDATYGERWSNHDFRTLCTLCIWDLQCFQTFRNYCLFCTFWLIRNFYSSHAHNTNYGKHSLKIISDRTLSVYIRFTLFSNFRNCCLFCTFWRFRNFYCGDEHDDNYGKHSLNHHFRHGAHSVYKIDIVLNLFEIAVCFAHFDLFEISTLVRRIILTMANIV